MAPPRGRELIKSQPREGTEGSWGKVWASDRHQRVWTEAAGGVNTEPGVKGRQGPQRRDRIAEKRRRESGTEFCSP